MVITYIIETVHEIFTALSSWTSDFALIATFLSRTQVGRDEELYTDAKSF